jgi:hypothetical protein
MRFWHPTQKLLERPVLQWKGLFAARSSAGAPSGKILTDAILEPCRRFFGRVHTSCISSAMNRTNRRMCMWIATTNRPSSG